jgi:hypothetical protein
MKNDLALMLLRNAIIEHCLLLKDALSILAGRGDVAAAAERIDSAVNHLAREAWRTMPEEQRAECRAAGMDVDSFGAPNEPD